MSEIFTDDSVKSLPRVVGPYVILELIEKSGISHVYRARKRELSSHDSGGEIALKRLQHKFRNRRFCLQQFRHAARVGTLLHHPNWVRVLGSRQLAGNDWIEMEYVNGITLSKLFNWALANKIRFPNELACFIVLEILTGLQYLHEQKDPNTGEELGTVHCDISLSNILISTKGEVKILDLGVAHSKWLESSEYSKLLIGKPGYFSPEQLTGKDVTNRSDLFSCGVIFYELLTQCRLFPVKSHLEMVDRVRDCVVTLPSAVAGDIHPALDKVVMRFLGKRPAHRYGSAAEAIEQLGAILDATGQVRAGSEDLRQWFRAHMLESQEKRVVDEE